MKNDVKLEVKKMLREKATGLTELTSLQNFHLNAARLWVLDKVQTSLFNQIRSFQTNSIIILSPLYPQIQELRRRENNYSSGNGKNEDDEGDERNVKKQCARLIKQALAEQLNTDPDSAEALMTQKAHLLYDKELAAQAFEYAEKEIIKQLEPYLETLPIYVNWFKNMAGIGVKSASKLLHIVKEYSRFKRISHLWQYFGVGDAEAQKRKRDQTCMYSTKGKDLLLGIIADNFIKQNSPYRIIYDKRKAKTKADPVRCIWHNLNPDGTKHKGKNMNPGHGESDARRVMMKRFLSDFLVASYKADGRELPENLYVVAILGHTGEPPVIPYPNL